SRYSRLRQSGVGCEMACTSGGAFLLIAAMDIHFLLMTGTRLIGMQSAHAVGARSRRTQSAHADACARWRSTKAVARRLRPKRLEARGESGGNGAGPRRTNHPHLPL